MNFDPKKHIRNIKGSDYLDVEWQLVWMRQDHPDWQIITEVVQTAKGAVQMKAQVLDASGHIIGTGHSMEKEEHFGDYLEKAETGAIGRALKHCGYSAQFIDYPVKTRPEPRGTVH